MIALAAVAALLAVLVVIDAAASRTRPGPLRFCACPTPSATGLGRCRDCGGRITEETSCP